MPHIIEKTETGLFFVKKLDGFS